MGLLQTWRLSDRWTADASLDRSHTLHADGDAALFPDGWSGTSQVLETVRKTYMIR